MRRRSSATRAPLAPRWGAARSGAVGAALARLWKRFSGAASAPFASRTEPARGITRDRPGNAKLPHPTEDNKTRIAAHQDHTELSVTLSHA